MDDEMVAMSTSLPRQLGYSVGHVLNDVCASLWFTYLLVFFHLVLGFSASQAGVLMVIGQVVDALSTPFVGYYSDHTDNALSAKYGKRKLWHLFGTVCVLASFPFIFSECVGCETAHKWAQMYYFAAFIAIFQIGWAAVQISHLSLIPELADDENTRTHLTAIRYGFTVFSNLLVYLVTWVVLHVAGGCDKEQIGPGDAWKFRDVVYVVMAVGVMAVLVFHTSVKEKSYQPSYEMMQSSNNHANFLRSPALYHVAGVYMTTRIVVNVSQILVPLYLHRTLSLPARALAVVPLTVYLGGLAAAGAQRLSSHMLTRKLHYLVGAAIACTGFVWVYFGHTESYKVYFIYVVAAFIGFGGAVMLVTSLALMADLVGARTDASAFVYGLMSFTDKLSCGLVILVIQKYADDASETYYRDVMAWVCGVATLLGLAFTLTLPRLSPAPSLLINDSGSTNADENSALLQANA